MRKTLGIVIFALWTAACGQGQTSLPTTPSSVPVFASGASGGVASVRQAGIQCSDAPVRWVTTNFSPEGRSARVLWVPVVNINTYEVEVLHNRNGETPKFVYSFVTNLTEASIDDKEDGGRYYVRVRVLNQCDVKGAWSETLIIYVDGRADSGGGQKPSCPYSIGRCYPPPPDEDDDEQDDDDGNNGHGNDDDHDDDSNPGNS